MAKSSISADVKAANSKLAQFLRRQEEEEMLLQIGKRKPKLEREEKRLPAGRARWSAEPDFKVPTCMVDRPRTADGATSFHFSYISISKEAVPTVKGKPIQGSFAKKNQPALDHSKYIERDAAVEISEGVKHADYIERPDAVEAVDPSALIAEAMERQLAAVYNETPTDDEASLLGLEAVVPDGIPSVFSNISDDPFERQEYWRAIERTEREPKSHRLFFDPEYSPRWWAAVEDAENLDPLFKEHLLKVAEEYRQWSEQPTSNDAAKEPFKCSAYPPPGSEDKLTADRAGQLIEQATSLPGFDYSQPPIEFQSGRGGRVQIRFVAELPHEISPEDRALIVQNFCDHLGGLETRVDPDGTERQVGMMYTAVIHAPDAHNDNRNYHLHIVAHDRPAKYLEEHSMWDFEYPEHFEIKGMQRVRWPHRQNKIGSINRAGDGADYERSGRNFVPAMRRDFARITNTVLEARGIGRRYDPRRYTEMGINRTPTEHLGTKAAALEAIGVPTTVGQLNAIAIWGDAERNIERQARKSDIVYQANQKRVESIIRQTASQSPKHPALPELRKLLVERERLTNSLAEDRRAIMAFDSMEAKAKSRAVRTRQTCLAYLREIENGTADGTTRVMKFQIEARYKDAQAHINQIDEALAPHRQALQEAARDVERREARVREIDRQVDPIATDLRDQLGVVVEEPKQEAPATTLAAAPAAAEVEQEGKASKKSKKKSATREEPSSYRADEVEAKASKKAPDLHEAANDVADKSEVDNTPANAGPVTMEGLPIAEGTIQPKAQDEPLKKELDAPAPTPEGLTPLRPKTEEPAEKPEPETITSDIEQVEKREPAKKDEPEDETERPDSYKSEPSAAQAPAPKEAAPAAPEPQPEKVDKRRKKQDPTLFELPPQEAPVKPGTKKAEHATWDALMDRIVKDRIPIKAEETPSGKTRYTVPALNDEDKETLKIRRFSYRTAVRLESIYDRQQQEIKRLARWIKEQGQDPDKLILEGRTAKLGDVRPAVRTLMRNWGRHPDILAVVRAENTRRIEAAKVAAEKPKVEQKKPAPSRKDTRPDLAEMRKQAEAKYPDPDTIHTKAAADFVRLLREVAPADKLREAADKIYTDAKARDDIHRYGSNVAVAYAEHVEGAQQREAFRNRTDKGGRG